MESTLESILLDHYHCTFFLPILTHTSENTQSSTSSKPLGVEPYLEQYVYRSDYKDKNEAEAFHYFTPTLRHILFDQGDTSSPSKHQLKPMQEWRLDKEQIESWRLCLHDVFNQGDVNANLTETVDPLTQQVVTIEAVHLYRYFNGHYLLSFRVKPEALTPEIQTFLADQNAQFLSDIDGSEPYYSQCEALQLEAWLRFTRLARILYPSFTEQEDEKKIASLRLFCQQQEKTLASAFEKTSELGIPSCAGERLSPIVIFLLQQFFAEDKREDVEAWVKQHIKLYDDRMFTSVAYGLAGKKHNDVILSRVVALSATTDRVADTFTDLDHYPYTESALNDYLAGTQCELWKGMGGVYTFTDVTNAYVYQGWFFRTIIAQKDIPNIYDRMMVQALFYQASLRHYDDEITFNTQRLLENQSDDTLDLISEQRKHFIQFTNQYWFKEITNQMQGKIIFRLQQKALGLEAHYQQLQEEINHTSDYLQVLSEKCQADIANRSAENANKIAKVAAMLAVIAALPVFNDIFKTEDSLWQSLVKYAEKYWCWPELYTRIGLSVTLIVITVILIRWIFRRKS